MTRFESLEDLPDRLKKVLPKEAQELYLKRYNQAVDDDLSPSDAHRIGWTAVKEKFDISTHGVWRR